MNSITASHRYLGAATGIRRILCAGYDAFEVMRAVLRHHQEDDQAAFAAFVLAGNAAANGRDCIAFAPSVPAAAPSASADVLDGASVTDVAVAVAALAGDVAARLAAAVPAATHPGDRAACEHAAAHAAEICDLLDGTALT
jgi:hypothetical protein